MALSLSELHHLEGKSKATQLEISQNQDWTYINTALKTPKFSDIGSYNVYRVLSCFKMLIAFGNSNEPKAMSISRGNFFSD